MPKNIGPGESGVVDGVPEAGDTGLVPVRGDLDTGNEVLWTEVA